MLSVGGAKEGAGPDEHHGPVDLLQEAVGREGQAGGIYDLLLNICFLFNASG